MSHIKQDKMLFNQAVGCATEVQAVAKMICGLLMDAKITRHPQCIWHIKGQDDIAYKYSYPPISADEFPVSEKATQENGELYLVQEANVEFRLILPTAHMAAMD